ncbi:helix-turn-helix transcriptional regulator [Rhodococcus zopfii]|uniref:helix-turn-helix transcriptional regulator n=1 Tax=Rhodococcus zopfii TaxID=43772 RepID=UPI000932397C|nr:helix-turn-helix domain-containing protein [Rhodococcus zopfii]
MTVSTRGGLHAQGLGSRKEVAEYLGKAPQTLAIWAMNGTGPKYFKVNGTCRYRWSDVDAWLEAQATGGSATNE